MVVNSTPPVLDLGYLALFFGLRVNELVLARAKRAGFGGVRESHGYVIQHLIESDRSISDLARRMEISQQAASKVIAELAKLEIVEVRTAANRREKRVRLSARGWEAVRRGRMTRRRIERRVIGEVGAKDYDQAKSILLRCLTALGGLERIRARRIRSPQ
jgi:DNA-binding MarR family transcriptional regulator